MLPMAGDTVRGEGFARLMHQTRVTRGAGGRCGHAPGISVALRAVMSNEPVCRCHLPWGKDGRSVPYFCPQRYIAKQQHNDRPAYDKPESPHRQTPLREKTLSKSVACQNRRRALSDFLGALAQGLNG